MYRMMLRTRILFLLISWKYMIGVLMLTSVSSNQSFESLRVVAEWVLASAGG